MIDATTKYKKFDKKDNVVGSVAFNMDSEESSGTSKVFNISRPIFDVLSDG